MWLALAGAAILGLVLIRIWARSAGRPADLGVRDGRLAPCPGTPNCVSTTSRDPGRRMDVLRFEGAEAEARAGLVRALQAFPGIRVVRNEPGYVAAEATVSVFGFVDDVEFLLDAAAGRIDFRSASRLGRSDLGVNRKRMARITRRFAEETAR